MRREAFEALAQLWLKPYKFAKDVWARLRGNSAEQTDSTKEAEDTSAGKESSMFKRMGDFFKSLATREVKVAVEGVEGATAVEARTWTQQTLGQKVVTAALFVPRAIKKAYDTSKAVTITAAVGVVAGAVLGGLFGAILGGIVGGLVAFGEIGRAHV